MLSTDDFLRVLRTWCSMEDHWQRHRDQMIEKTAERDDLDVLRKWLEVRPLRTPSREQEQIDARMRVVVRRALIKAERAALSSHPNFARF